MSNWKFFVSLLKMYQKYFVPPKVIILEQRNDYLEKYHDAWGYYEPEERVMRILKEFDCIPIRIHEYGHWINACVYFVLEIIWEFFWWGTWTEKYFQKERRKDSKMKGEDWAKRRKSFTRPQRCWPCSRRDAGALRVGRVYALLLEIFSIRERLHWSFI